MPSIAAAFGIFPLFIVTAFWIACCSIFQRGMFISLSLLVLFFLFLDNPLVIVFGIMAVKIIGEFSKVTICWIVFCSSLTFPTH